VCRGDRVHATDGDIGRVQGLVIDRRSRHVTHVLLQEGHLWGRREVAIPVSTVASTTGGIQLNIAKQEVQARVPATSTGIRNQGRRGYRWERARRPAGTLRTPAPQSGRRGSRPSRPRPSTECARP
jgi:PRC-barrel domain